MKYSIHPMEFIASHLNGKNINEPVIELTSAPNKNEEIHELIPVNASVESIIERMNMTDSPALSKATTAQKATTIHQEKI